MVLQKFLGFRANSSVPETNVFLYAVLCSEQGNQGGSFAHYHSRDLTFTTLTLLVEKARAVPIYRRKKRPTEVTGQWGQLSTLLTAVLKASTSLNPF